MSPTLRGLKSLRVSWIEPMMYQCFSGNISASKMANSNSSRRVSNALLYSDPRFQKQQENMHFVERHGEIHNTDESIQQFQLMYCT